MRKLHNNWHSDYFLQVKWSVYCMVTTNQHSDIQGIREYSHAQSNPSCSEVQLRTCNCPIRHHRLIYYLKKAIGAGALYTDCLVYRSNFALNSLHSSLRLQPL